MKRVVIVVMIVIVLSSCTYKASSQTQIQDDFYPVPEMINSLVGYTVSSTYMTEWNVQFYDPYNEHGKIPDHASFIPLLQNYESGDPYQYDWQIYWASCAGINTFVFDCGIYDTTSEPYLAINRSLSESAFGSSFNFTITYLLSQSFWDKVGTPSINLTERVMDDFETYIDDFLWRDNLLKKDDMPIIYLLLPWDIPSWTNDISDPALLEVIAGIRSEFKNRLGTDVYLLADLTWPGDSPYYVSTCQGIFDGCFKPGGMVFLWANHSWDDMNCQYDEMFYWDNQTSSEFHTTFSSSNLTFIPSFSPGFNNSKIPDATWLNEKLIIVERNLTAFEIAVGIMKGYIDMPLNILYLHSWNDFQEGTCLEPTHEYGTNFLDAIRDGLSGEDQTEDIFTPMSFAFHWIQGATSAIDELRGTRSPVDIVEAETLLTSANEYFTDNDYANATIFAHAAYEYITSAEFFDTATSSLMTLLITASIIGVVVVVAGGLIYRRRK